MLSLPFEDDARGVTVIADDAVKLEEIAGGLDQVVEVSAALGGYAHRELVAAEDPARALLDEAPAGFLNPPAVGIRQPHARLRPAVDLVDRDWHRQHQRHDRHRGALIVGDVIAAGDPAQGGAASHQATCRCVCRASYSASR